MADLSLGEWLDKVHQAVWQAADEPPVYHEAYCVAVYADHVIIRFDDAFYRASYKLKNGTVTLAPRDKWEQVTQEWVAAKSGWLSMLAAETHKAGAPAGNALKTVSKTETELRVSNYMVLFGGKDLYNEWFTKSTAFDSPYTDLGFLYVDWEHGLAPEDEPGAHEPLGYVDWKTAKIDDKGLFVERVLNRRNKYIQWLEELIEEGLFGTSSQAIGAGVEKTASGEIVRWPLMRDALTVQPAEPRMMSQNTLLRIKALADKIPALRSLAEPKAPPEAQRPETGGEPVAPGAAESEGDATKARKLALELELLQLEN